MHPSNVRQPVWSPWLLLMGKHLNRAYPDLRCREVCLPDRWLWVSMSNPYLKVDLSQERDQSWVFLQRHILSITLLGCVLSVATYSSHQFCLFICLFVSSIGQREVAVLLCSVFQTYDWMVAFLSLLLQLDHQAGLVNWNPHFVVQKWLLPTSNCSISISVQV